MDKGATMSKRLPMRTVNLAASELSALLAAALFYRSTVYNATRAERRRGNAITRAISKLQHAPIRSANRSRVALRDLLEGVAPDDETCLLCGTRGVANCCSVVAAARAALAPEKQSPAPAAASESNAPTAPAVTAARPTPAGSPNPASAAAASLEVEALGPMDGTGDDVGIDHEDLLSAKERLSEELQRRKLRAKNRRGGHHE